MTNEYRERVKNMLQVSTYMFDRVVEHLIEGKERPEDLRYDIIAECQCRNQDGTLGGQWDCIKGEIKT